MLHTPYTYLIGWSRLGIWYYGSRYAKNCHPRDLWNPYVTSSEYVGRFIEEHGSPDIIQVRRTFKTSKEATDWETKVLTRLRAKQRPDFLNRSNVTCKMSQSEYTGAPESTWYTDGTTNLRLYKHEPIPEGFYKGRDTSTCKSISQSRKGKFTGESNSFFGKHHSEETKKILSEKCGHSSERARSFRLGKKDSDETRLKKSIASKGNQHAKGYKHSEETLQKIGIDKGSISITNGTKNKFILPGQEIPAGWWRGASRRKRGPMSEEHRQAIRKSKLR